MKKTDARKLSRDAQEALRQRVILAIVEEGIKQKDAVNSFLKKLYYFVVGVISAMSFNDSACDNCANIIDTIWL